jgi:hypothetical protein
MSPIINKVINNSYLPLLLKAITKDNHYQIDISTIDHLFLTSIYNNKNSLFISDNVFCGQDSNLDLSIIKSLMELTERLAQDNEEIQEQMPHLNDNSDGFAAFPIYSPRTENQSALMARNHALSEAIERYAWSHWWDNHHIGHKIIEITSEPVLQQKNIKPIIDTITKLINVENIFLVTPYFGQYLSRELVIILIKKKGGGFFSGGAVGLLKNRETTIFRSLSELLRHILAYEKMLINDEDRKTFYEKRLYYFASGQGDLLVEQRIKIKSFNKISFPSLVLDRKISHLFENFVYVHRCFFKGQNPFLSGSLEKLCL